MGVAGSNSGLSEDLNRGRSHFKKLHLKMMVSKNNLPFFFRHLFSGSMLNHEGVGSVRFGDLILL